MCRWYIKQLNQVNPLAKEKNSITVRIQRTLNRSILHTLFNSHWFMTLRGVVLAWNDTMLPLQG